MKIEDMIINEDLIAVERAFEKAKVDDVVELCRSYLAVLGEYRDRLLALRGVPEIDLKNATDTGRGAVEEARGMVREALAGTAQKRAWIGALLNSFILITGYEAVATFNQLRYKGFDTWEIYSSGSRLKYIYADKGMDMEKTIETASLLRREAYVEDKTVFFRG